MNIQGLILLKKGNFNMPLLLFEEFNEIGDFLNKIDNEKELILIGFDKRTKITDNPYKIKRFRKSKIKNIQVKSSFEDLNKEMDKEEIPLNERIFGLGTFFDKLNTKYEGQALIIGRSLHFDFCIGPRVSGQDMPPWKSFTIPIVNNKFYFDDSEKYGELWEIIQEVCKDLKKIELENPYLDFAVLTDKIVYYDLFSHKPKYN